MLNASWLSSLPATTVPSFVTSRTNRCSGTTSSSGATIARRSTSVERRLPMSERSGPRREPVSPMRWQSRHWLDSTSLLPLAASPPGCATSGSASASAASITTQTPTARTSNLRPLPRRTRRFNPEGRRFFLFTNLQGGMLTSGIRVWNVDGGLWTSWNLNSKFLIPNSKLEHSQSHLLTSASVVLVSYVRQQHV